VLPRWTWRLIALAGVLAGMTAAMACLPDLTLVITPLDAGAAPRCGDGTIDPSVGEECDPGDGVPIGCVGCKIDCDAGLLDPATKHCYFTAPLDGSVTTSSFHTSDQTS
jgi:hypothetical protein